MIVRHGLQIKGTDCGNRIILIYNRSDLIGFLREQLSRLIAVRDLYGCLDRIKADGIAILHAQAVDHALIQIMERLFVVVHAHDDSVTSRFYSGPGGPHGITHVAAHDAVQIRSILIIMGIAHIGDTFAALSL